MLAQASLQTVPPIIYSCEQRSEYQAAELPDILGHLHRNFARSSGHLQPGQVALCRQRNHLDTGLDYFLELNTLQCSSADNVTSNCEIDSGRFPVELKSESTKPAADFPQWRGWILEPDGGPD